LLLLEVAFLLSSKPFESLRAALPVYFGMIIACGEPSGRDSRLPFRTQLRHYSLSGQKSAPFRRALFAWRDGFSERLSSMPANG
jgi:hypothetical protein